MKQALEVLLAGAVDYAGLFPPAAMDMAGAVHAYTLYLGDPQRDMLGRFVVPVVRLREFDGEASGLLPIGESSTPWRLSALPGPDLVADFDLALKFNDRHAIGSDIGHAVIDTLEIKAQIPEEILAATSRMPQQLSPFFEIPISSDPAKLVDAIRRGGAFAKARTGGITSDAFPRAEDVVRFMVRCRDARVAFKLTAGLHHPIRAEYRLTYDDNAPRGVMFGYLNMFVAAGLAWSGADESTVLAALNSRSASDFTYTEEAMVFGGRSVAVSTIRDARQNFISSFGSCSFREPVDELAALSLL